MNTDELLEKIGTLIDQKIEPLKQAQAHTNTALKALGAGQQDLIERAKTIESTMATKTDVDATVEAAKSELKAEIHILNAILVRKVQSHERRIENVERSTNTPNPDKH